MAGLKGITELLNGDHHGFTAGKALAPEYDVQLVGDYARETNVGQERYIFYNVAPSEDNTGEFGDEPVYRDAAVGIRVNQLDVRNGDSIETVAQDVTVLGEPVDQATIQEWIRKLERNSPDGPGYMFLM